MKLSDLQARNVLINPCPVCMQAMTVKKTSAMGDGGYRKWFFFLYCNQCGYGPSHAFDTIAEAIGHWNRSCLSTTVPAELLAKKAANLFTPRLFD